MAYLGSCLISIGCDACGSPVLDADQTLCRSCRPAPKPKTCGSCGRLFDGYCAACADFGDRENAERFVFEISGGIFDGRRIDIEADDRDEAIAQASLIYVDMFDDQPSRVQPDGEVTFIAREAA